MRTVRVLSSLLFSACALFSAGCPAPDPAAGSPVAEFTAGTANLNLQWGRLTNTCEPAQSFFVSADASCSRVDLRLGPHHGAPGFDYIVQIRTDNSGEPSGVILASASRFGGGLAAGDWNSWPLGVPVPLSAGQTYWIVCLTSEALNDTYVTLAADGAAGYSYGSAMSSDNGGPWADVLGADIYFRVLR